MVMSKRREGQGRLDARAENTTGVWGPGLALIAGMTGRGGGKWRKNWRLDASRRS